MLPAIFGLSGDLLTDAERGFFSDADPAGYILFRRNCVDRAQLKALTDDLRAIHGRPDLPILIDQEGGRVSRMAPPAWPEFPAAAEFARLYDKAPISAIEAARANAGAIAAVLRDCGINVDCLPLLDVRAPGASDIIGDRALGEEPMQVAALGRAILDGLREGVVVGVIKHMPGHGRAGADSHVALPVVDATPEMLERDIEPFTKLRTAPMGMTAHVIYTAWDPDRCASLSPTVIADIIRARIGFENFLMSDDIGMSALSGSMGERASGVVESGCDSALHCSGDLAEMEDVAAALCEITQISAERRARAMATIAGAVVFADYDRLAAQRDELLAYA